MHKLSRVPEIVKCPYCGVELRHFNGESEYNDYVHPKSKKCCAERVRVYDYDNLRLNAD